MLGFNQICIKMKSILKDCFAFLALSVLLSFGCLPNPSDGQENSKILASDVSFPYNLSMPDNTWWLPHSLQEISGIAYVSHNNIACIQDEKGKLYIYSLDSSKIIEEYKFAKDADFEDIEYHDGVIHVLESNGTIFQFAYPINKQETKVISTDLKKSLDFEAFCYSNRKKKYLLAAKQAKEIFVFDSKKKAITEKFAVKNYNLNKLKASGITIDFDFKKIYILSSVYKTILVLDFDYNVLTSIKLDSKIFKQPEGICISPNGDLLISNEGAKGKANILQFKRTDE